ncbi:MAG: hypothetical protein ACYC6O_06835 [Thermoleophilia bacterium]
MRYCPNCEKPYPEEDYKCPDCGYSPESEHEAEVTAKMPVPAVPEGAAGKGLKSRKNIILIALGAAVVVATIVGGIILYLHGRSEPVATPSTSSSSTKKKSNSEIQEYQDNLTENWNTLRDITVELVKKDGEVADQASLNSFNALLTVSADKIEQIRNEMGGMQVPDDYKLRHKNLVDAVGSYRDYLKSLIVVTSVDPAKVTAADFEPVNTSGEGAQKKVAASEKQLPFLRALPDECFILHTTLNTFYTTIWQQPQPQTPRTPAPATPTPAPASSETDAMMATVLGDSAGSWNGADNYEVVSYDPTTNSGIILVTYYLPDTIRYTELYMDKDQYGWYVSYENTYEVPY